MKGINWIRYVVGAGLLLYAFSCVNRPGKKDSKQSALADSLARVTLKQHSDTPIKLYIEPSTYPLSATSILYEILNMSVSSVLLGCYSIEYFDGNEWKDIPLGYIFADEEIRIFPGKLFKGKAGLNPGYMYSPGKYKLSWYVHWELIPKSDMGSVYPKEKLKVESSLGADTLVIREPLLSVYAPGAERYRIRKYVRVLLEAEFILR